MSELFIPKNVRRFKSIRHFKTPSGSHVIVLPTCSVALKHLVEENWTQAERGKDIGHVRKVARISRIVQLPSGRLIRDRHGKKTVLYVKSPERDFDVDPVLGDDGPWVWNVARKPVHVEIADIRIEKQATWEARILLGLKQKGIRAEVPQAIVIDKDGRRKVITKGISKSGDVEFNTTRFYENIERVKKRVAESGFIEADLRPTNVIEDSEGVQVFDVNRWEWPPFTNEYRKRLIAAVHEEAKKGKKYKFPVGI